MPISDYGRFGAGGRGLTSQQQADEIEALSDPAKRAAALEQKTTVNLRGVQANSEDKLVYLKKRIKELEDLAAKMDTAKNSEAARNYRRAANIALQRIARLGYSR
jgi:predicted phage-related endonuclease